MGVPNYIQEWCIGKSLENLASKDAKVVHSLVLPLITSSPDCHGTSICCLVMACDVFPLALQATEKPLELMTDISSGLEVGSKKERRKELGDVP